MHIWVYTLSSHILCSEVGGSGYMWEKRGQQLLNQVKIDVGVLHWALVVMTGWDRPP